MILYNAILLIGTGKPIPKYIKNALNKKVYNYLGQTDWPCDTEKVQFVWGCKLRPRTQKQKMHLQKVDTDIYHMPSQSKG